MPGRQRPCGNRQTRRRQGLYNATNDAKGPVMKTTSTLALALRATLPPLTASARPAPTREPVR